MFFDAGMRPLYTAGKYLCKKVPKTTTMPPSEYLNKFFFGALVDTVQP
jgi:hypothetical protein